MCVLMVISIDPFLMAFICCVCAEMVSFLDLIKIGKWAMALSKLQSRRWPFCYVT